MATVVRTGRALGTSVTLVAAHQNPERAEAAIVAAFERLDEIEDCLSIYRSGSELCRLNHERVLEAPHPWLVAVLQEAQILSAETAGAFDVTVQPLWRLYAECQREGRSPDMAETEAACRLVDWRKLDISPNRVRLQANGMAVTLNGIAQGFATDQATAVLQAHGIERALIDVGEIAALGVKPDGSSWVAGIQHPREPDGWITLATLDGRCLATSGDYATSFRPDRSAHHIFDPHTGRSPGELSSVSVVAPTGILADGLSTAVFALGPEAGAALIERTPDTDALLVWKNGRTWSTPGFPHSALA